MEQTFLFSSPGIQYLQGTLGVLYTEWFRFGEYHHTGKLLTMLHHHHHHHHPSLPSLFSSAMETVLAEYLSFINYIGCNFFSLIHLAETKGSNIMLISMYQEIATDPLLFSFSTNNKEIYLLTKCLLYVAFLLALLKSLASGVRLPLTKNFFLWIRVNWLPDKHDVVVNRMADR